MRNSLLRHRRHKDLFDTQLMNRAYGKAMRQCYDRTLERNEAQRGRDSADKRCAKWRDMYEQLIEEIHRASQWSYFENVKVKDDRPLREFDVQAPMPRVWSLNSPRLMEFHYEALYWLDAAIETNEFQRLVRFKLETPEGDVFQQFSKEGWEFQKLNKRDLIMLIAEEFIKYITNHKVKL